MKRFIKKGLVGLGLVGVGLAVAYAVKLAKDVEDVDLDEGSDENDDFFEDEDSDIATEWDNLPDDDLTRDDAILSILSSTADYTTEDLAELSDAEIYSLYNKLNK